MIHLSNAGKSCACSDNLFTCFSLLCVLIFFGTSVSKLNGTLEGTPVFVVSKKLLGFMVDCAILFNIS